MALREAGRVGGDGNGKGDKIGYLTWAVKRDRSFILRFSRFFRIRQWPGARHTETAAEEAVGGELRSEPNVLEMRRSQTSKVAWSSSLANVAFPGFWGMPFAANALG